MVWDSPLELRICVPTQSRAAFVYFSKIIFFNKKEERYVESANFLFRAASYEALGRKTLARILRVRCHYLHKQPSWNEWSPSVDAFGASEAQVEALLQQKLLAPTISVNYSTIRSIPTSITSSMKHLTSLQITDALLTDFSLVCENLLSLTALTLSGNTIREIPSSITRLTNLRELSLVDNSIAHIPEGFSKLEALHTLQMAENCLEEISKELLNCSRLTKLMLSCNRIKVIPSAINKLKALKVTTFSRVHALR